MSHNHKAVRKMTAADEIGSDITKSRAVIFPRLKPSRRSVTLRVPTPVLKKLFNGERGLPFTPTEKL